LLEGHFKFFIDHSTLKYLVNKSILEGASADGYYCFKEFNFEVMVKLRRTNVGLDHLSRVETESLEGHLDDQLLDFDLFKVEVVLDYLEDITTFLTMGVAPQGYSNHIEKKIGRQIWTIRLIVG
jgi:hypothetical protein